MRQMLRLLRSAGLALVGWRSYVLAEIGRADFWLSAIARFQPLLPASGTMSESEAKTLADALLKASDEGVFFRASNYYSYVATRRFKDGYNYFGRYPEKVLAFFEGI